jgi:ribonucleoside-diphosphate reductase alpha chain
MQVVKRDGRRVDVSFDKVLQRITRASKGLSVNPAAVAREVLSQIYDGVKTTELDEFAATLCANLSTEHPDYATLAAVLTISNHQKNTVASFATAMRTLYLQSTPLTNEPVSYVNHTLYNNSQIYEKEIDEHIDHDRDYLIDYFGFKTLEKSYLLKDSRGKIIERPQHLWMRVSLAIWGMNLPRVFETYDLMSKKYFTHATPTLFNAGTLRQQLSSCFLVAMESDSLEGIYNTLSNCANISKWAGGIGLHVHNIRAKGSLIKGTNGRGDGLVPMLRVFNTTARYVNQGGRRNGSFAIYLEPWHADIEDFLRLKLNTGAEEDRARDLFYGLWVPDLFMERVNADGDWTMFCPNEAPGLADVVGDKFKELYERYEQEGRGRKKIKAQKLWFQILDSQMETGTPYLCYKDAANLKSNQQNLGVIKSSNLCTEIIEYSDSNESAVCNLASIGLPAFVKNGVFNFDHLREVTKIVIRNLNRVIDINFYPTKETERSNMRNRPVGLGVQGLADVFALLKLSWDSSDAAYLNQRIFEHMYYAAVESSAELCDANYGPYETFEGSPMSKGILQPDMWNVKPLSTELDWDGLREKAKKGVRNSLLIAPMPTASTSQILGYNECFEPFNSNLYTRRTLAGEYIVINKYLLKELMDLGLWNQNLKQQLVLRNGSVQGIPEIPLDIQDRYRTVYEMKQKTLIDMAASRGAFICQSQSLNLFVAEPTYAKLTSMHFYAWKQGLKTGCYYLRTKAQVMAQKFTIDPRMLAGSNAPVQDYDSEPEHDEDNDDNEPKETREQMKARLAKEYEEELSKGCLTCSA